MATIKSLNINLSMGVAAFKKDVAAAGNTLAGLVKRVNGLKESIFSVSNALAGMAIVSVGKSIVDFVGGAMDRIDGLNDSATQLGTSVKNLSELGYAAQMTGSSLETFTAGLLKMQGVMGKSDEDSDKAAEKFEEMGLSVAELQAMDPADAFFKIGAEIAKLPNASQQAAAAISIFGKKGQELLPMLLAGAEGAAELRKEAAAIGIGINDIDAYKIGAAKDALDAVWSVLDGMGNTLAISVAPYVTAIGGALKDWAADGNSVGIMTTLFEGFETMILSIIEAIDKMVNAMGGVEVAGKKWNNFLLGDDGAFFGWQLADAVSAEDIAAAEAEAKAGGKTDTSNLREGFANIKKRAEEAAKKQAIEAEEKRKQAMRGFQAAGGAAGAAGFANNFNSMLGMGAGGASGAFDVGQQIVDDLEKHRKDISRKLSETIKEGLKSPAEKLQDELTAAAESFQDGFLSGDDFESMRDKKLEELAKSEADMMASLKTDLPKLILPSAIRKGSAEDINMANNFKAGNKGLEPIKSLDKTAKEQLKETRKQTEVLRNFKKEEIVK